MGPWVIIIRYLPYIIGAAVVLGLLGLGTYKVYEAGRLAERAEQLEVQEANRKVSEFAMKTLQEKLKKESHDAQIALTTIIGNYADEIQKLNSDIAALSSRKLRVKASYTCPDNGLSGIREDSSSGGITNTGDVELSEGVSNDIRRNFIHGAEIVPKINALIGIIRSAPHCFEFIGDQ